MHILSTNVGTARRNPAKRGADAMTGHDKRAVPEISVFDPGAKSVDNPHPSGVAGDFVGDAKHHGGSLQAVYAVGREDLDAWGELLGRGLPDGWMGENLTTRGGDVNASLVGSHWQVGTARLRVSVPRIPCATFADVARTPRWVKRFTEAGGAGTYLQVLQAGTIRPGDRVEVIHRPDHGVTVREHFWALTCRPELSGHVLRAAAELPPESLQRLRPR